MVLVRDGFAVRVELIECGVGLVNVEDVCLAGHG
jgi:hypothetical protein